MNTFLTIVGIVVTLVALWAGVREVNLSTPAKSALSFLELALAAAALVQLGWPIGAFVAIGVNLLGLAAWSVYLAIQNEDILSDAAVQGGFKREQLEELERRLRRGNKPFKFLRPLRRARLIRYLAQRARSITEIEHMAPAIATLWVINRPELESLVEKFDRLLRLSGQPAEESMRLADVLTTSTIKSAVTFEEMLNGMLAAYDPRPD